ncbi:protein SSX7-like [Rhinolophus ferrumequinum]|uniref:protein SSX7-like n=1 Tax=Rhinolophus ferrumequinum TaxID=59479 RepID=UPI00140F5EDC|nr:protein SSX7-like [Rhinolophus ferrumequinum]
MAKLGDLQKRTYVYMKRNYDYMTLIGLNSNRPYFMCSLNQSTHAPESNFDEDQSPGNQNENPQEASDVQWIEDEKEMPMEPTREENDTMPLPVTPASEPAPKKLCTPGEVSSSGQETEKMSGPSKVKSSVWAHRLQERKNRVVYEEISDPEEDD